MECRCEYCKEVFVPKRIDARYCSHSCRQLAYVLRKAQIDVGISVTEKQMNNSETSIVSENKQEASTNNALIMHDPSIEEGKNEELSINLTDKADESSIKANEIMPYLSKEEDISVNTEPELSVNKNKRDGFIDTKPIISVVKPVREEEKYQHYNSLYLDEIVELTQERDNTGILFSFLHNKTAGSACWISLRYRCLLECLLSFSEMQSIELDDLKEVCNAFTGILESKSFKVMIPEYPYLNEIPKLRGLIKNLCLNAKEQTLTFRLKKETKLQLIASRWELANYVPKVSFDSLNFKE